ncbi:hypothetical protein C2I19_18155 [Chromobacterium alticapitis]|uniref:Uncharacterized protein n=1 Tax=Chromobacterium alticapitis TaxID=2073169 RepID=A0A2S5DC29_9NEIS|nr:hypothetical protein C2I19_18155 [Chromobacterium alticapitis]
MFVMRRRVHHMDAQGLGQAGKAAGADPLLLRLGAGQHDHGISEAQFGMQNLAVLDHGKTATETKHPLQPLHRRHGIVVTQARVHAR